MNNKRDKIVENRTNAQKVLASNKSDDLKLLEVFEIYKDDLKKDYAELYYALLGWRYAHFSALEIVFC